MTSYADVLGRKFEDIVWVMDNVEDYSTLKMIKGVAPKKEELESLAALGVQEKANEAVNARIVGDAVDIVTNPRLDEI